MSEDLKDKFFALSTNAGVAKKTPAEMTRTTRKTDEAISVQSIAGGEIHNSTQNLIINLADRKFFFDMELRTEQRESLPSDVKLEVGKFYFVRVSVSLNPFIDSPSVDQNMLKQQEVIIDQRLDITLESSTLTMHGEIGQLELRCRRDWYIDFLIQVGDRCQEELSSLELKYQESGSHNRLRFASSLAVKVNTNQKVISPKTVNLTANIANAENAAILYVTPNGQKEWSIQGISPHEAINQTIKAPNIPVNIWDYAKKSLGSLLKWLRETISYFQNQCNLAIVDLTSQQISWERIELKTNVYLGVEAKVVRWVEQEARGEKILLDLPQPQNYEGRLVDYKHPRDLNCDDIDNALNSWRQGLCKHKQQPVAIGLLNCHQRLTDISFEMVARRVDDYSLFLFANCPYSAVVTWEDAIPSGIAATALSEVASSYLGTMGEIDTGFAEQLQAKFLELARQKNGVKPVDFLRSLRFTYAKMLLSDDDIKRETAERLLPYAFSYVYYGNPDDVVKITGGGQS